MLSVVKRHIYLLLVVAITINIHSCGENETIVIIFHTNDSHSEINNFPQMVALVNEERETSDHVFLVSAGDIFSGNPLIDFYEPPGYPKIDLMNRAGYNVNTIGNHEFDYGIDILMDRMEQADFPFILANLDSGNSLLPQPDPYYIARAGRIRLAFLGLVQLNESGIPSTHPDRVANIEFFPPVETAARYSYLTGKADAVIGLTHVGFRTDTLMARRYPWFDVLIGGHGHVLITDPVEYNGVLVTQAGSRLRHVGKITLLFRGRELVSKKAEMISIAEITGHDRELAALVEEYNNNPVMSRVIGRLENPLIGKPAIGAFITDTYRKYSDLDFAFHNFGGIRVSRMEGEIRIKDIYEMDPFGNQLVSMYLTYSELQDLIGNSLNPDYTPELQISGGRFEIHVSNSGSRIRIFDKQNNELDHDAEYLVGMPDYIATVFDFERKDQGTELGITTAEIVIGYISEKLEIDYSASERSRIIPVN